MPATGTPTQAQRTWEAADVMALLANIPDPEIPVTNLRELGVLREVRRTGSSFEVVITPTYSGCPAIAQMEDDIRAALASHQISATITTRLAPAWTTDWLSPATLEKLRRYGIAPPATGSARGEASVIQFGATRSSTREPDVRCPRCDSINTTPTSHFGSTACKALYRCLDCMEPFDYFKPY